MEMTICSHCGRETYADSMYCDHCDGPLEVEGAEPGVSADERKNRKPEKGFKKCISCGKRKAEWEDLCDECGVSLPDDIWYVCPSCGREFSGETTLCSECVHSEQDWSAQGEVHRGEGAGEHGDGERSAGEGDRQAQTKTPRVVSQKNPAVACEIRDGDVMGRYGDISTAVLNNTFVSGRHVSFHLQGGMWYVRDEGSKNGTRVGLRSLEPGENIPLKDGDVIVLADEVFIFKVS